MSLEETQRAQNLGKRVVLAAFLGFATLFVLASTWQLMIGTFGMGTKPLSVELDPEAKACADGVRKLAGALDRAMAKASAADSEKSAVDAFEAGLAPDWNEETAISSQCESHPHGRDAFSALLRLRRTEEGFVRRQVVEIAPVRRHVQAYLPR
ncbi:MAG: hypothetical protein ABIP39_00880 [Polyangiaceae bacterium]